MAATLSIGLQKKVGLPDYGSLGASCHVEFEIDVGMLAHDVEAFRQRARQAFAACQQAVNDELARQQSQRPAPGRPANGNGHSNGSASNGHHHARLATQSQVKAIRAIASRQRLDLIALLEGRFGVARPDDLTLADASTLIDDLKAPASGGR